MALQDGNPARTRGRVLKTLKPGQPGTLKLARRHGLALVCVRYRQGADATTRITTVELVIEEAPIQRRLSERSIVGVRIEWGELHLSTRAKALGARWDRATQLWRMSLRSARQLGLEHRIQQNWP